MTLRRLEALIANANTNCYFPRAQLAELMVAGSNPAMVTNVLKQGIAVGCFPENAIGKRMGSSRGRIALSESPISLADTVCPANEINVPAGYLTRMPTIRTAG